MVSMWSRQHHIDIASGMLASSFPIPCPTHGWRDLGPTWSLLGGSYFFLITQAWPRLAQPWGSLLRIDQMLTCEALSQMWGFLLR